MTSSHRNPKELKSHIQNCQSESFLDDIELFDEAFMNLRHVPNDDKSEVGMMRSRIEEQSRLIMVLKKSADDYLNKNNVLEKLNEDLNNQIEDMNISMKKAEEKNTLINQRFKTLSDYNEEIIKFKDDYKSKNVKLNAELAELKNKMNSSAEALRFAALQTEMENKVNELNEKCESYEKEQEKLTLKFERIKTNINKSHEDNLKLVNEEWQGKMNQKVNEVSILNEKIASKDSEFLKYKSEIDQNYKEINALKTKLSSKDKENQSKIKDMENLVEKQKSEFEAKSSHFSISINQVTKEKLHHASQAKKLAEENKILSDRCSNLDKQVKELEEELNASSILELKGKNEQLQAEFESYKKYQSVLFEKEREVNAKLRFLVS